VNIEQEMREFRWTVLSGIALALLMALVGSWGRSGEQLSARTNATMFFLGLGLISVSAYSYFVLRALLSLADRLLLLGLFGSSLLVLLQADRVPGLDGGGLQYPITAIVAAVMAFLGHRSRR
jgi:hypothetical protein